MHSLFDRCNRRFGVELEYNALDNNSRSKDKNNLPVGIFSYSNSIAKKIGKSVDVNGWQYTNNNNAWVVKPDSSCGLEVCSPPMVASEAIHQLKDVVDGLNDSKFARSDGRCSFHVHVEIEDLSENQVWNLFLNWVRNELFFYLLTNNDRWLNHYCQPIGFSAIFDKHEALTYSNMLRRLSEYKYYAINLYHYKKKRKKTMEFRIMGNNACINSIDAVNWCKILICFVERAKDISMEKWIKSMSYANFPETISFMDFDGFFNDKNICGWIAEKLKLAQKADGLGVKNPVWEKIIEFSKDDIDHSINILEVQK